MNKSKPSKNSALIFILKGFIPYTEENMLLAFKPTKFFNELEKISKYRKSTLKHAYWRARKDGLVEVSGKTAKLTDKGIALIKPFTAKKLSNKSRLMVIFDIPEDQGYRRQQFRNILKSWGFEQIQKSVWVTDVDYRGLLKEVIEELEITKFVEIYEGLRLHPNQ